jgi:hypothetical protein
MRTSVRLSASRERNGSLCVTVDSSQVLLVRRAIVRSGLHPIGIVKAVPIAGGTRVRMLIALAPHLIRPVEEAIARALAPA